MATIPIRDVPGEAVEPSGNELILIDNGVDMQKATINDAVTPKATEITDQKISDLDLGSASQADIEDFATAEQGNKADSAVQPDDLAPVATSGDYNDLANLPTLGTAAEADVDDFAPAAQAVPTGGSSGQVLAKASGDDNDVEWVPSESTTAVSYAPQVLTPTEQQQARINIGANDASNLTQGTIPPARVADLPADKAYRQGNILGSVSQSGGVPTGALIERGSNANGGYMLFAGGLAVCSAIVSADLTATGNQIFPLPISFSDTPVPSWGHNDAKVGGDVGALQNAFIDILDGNWRWRCDGTGTSTSSSISIGAIGRWY